MKCTGFILALLGVVGVVCCGGAGGGEVDGGQDGEPPIGGDDGGGAGEVCDEGMDGDEDPGDEPAPADDGGAGEDINGDEDFMEDPIVFVHGYMMNSSEWDTMIRRFRDRGYTADHLFAIDYSSSLDSNIVHARDELPAFVDGVLQQTGAQRVDLVSHSNGGMSARLYIAFYGGADKVRDFVSVSGTHHGTQLACLGTWTGEAAEEQCPPYAGEAESHNGVQWMLNGDPDVMDVDETPFGVEDGGAVAYHALWTEDDLIDVPAHTCCLNQTFRGDCGDPINVMFSGVGHIEMATDPAVFEAVYDRVRRRNPSRP